MEGGIKEVRRFFTEIPLLRLRKLKDE